jgi:hypothetical protein
MLSRSISGLWAVGAGCMLTVMPPALDAATLGVAMTGQTVCYDATGAVIPCAGTGQDGDTLAGVPWPDPRFTDNGDGTITDNLTGLIWLKAADCLGKIKWLDALAAANALANGQCGLTDGSVAGDWRLPNILEIVSLINLGAANPGDWLETYGFTGLYGVAHWSSTTVADGLNWNAWGLSTSQGFMAEGVKGATYEVWAVRGTSTGPAPVWKTGQATCYDDLGAVVACAGTGQDGDHQAGVAWPDPRFTNNGDGTVTDNLTGLVWLQNANCFGNRTWTDTLADAQSLADGACGLSDGSAAGDWRLPNGREVFSLVDYSRSDPALAEGHPFTNLPAPAEITSFWSSSTWALFPTYGWYDLIAETGQFVFAVKTSLFRVWPVRDANEIFSNGFESGDAGEWVVTGVGHVAADPSAAHSGSYGLEVTVDASCSSLNDSELVDRTVAGLLVVESCDSVIAGEGFTVASGGEATLTAGTAVVLQNGFSVESGGRLTAALDPTLAPAAFVQNDSPTSETTYLAEFFVKLDDLSLGSGDEVEHLVAFDAAGQPVLKVLIRSGPVMALEVRDNEGTPHVSGDVAMTSGWNKVAVAWQAAAGVTASLTLNDGTPEELTGLDTDERRIDFVRWWWVGGTMGDSSGTVDMDDFTSSR